MVGQIGSQLLRWYSLELHALVLLYWLDAVAVDDACQESCGFCRPLGFHNGGLNPLGKVIIHVAMSCIAGRNGWLPAYLPRQETANHVAGNDKRW